MSSLPWSPSRRPPTSPRVAALTGLSASAEDPASTPPRSRISSPRILPPFRVHLPARGQRAQAAITTEAAPGHTHYSWDRLRSYRDRGARSPRSEDQSSYIPPLSAARSRYSGPPSRTLYAAGRYGSLWSGRGLSRG